MEADNAEFYDLRGLSCPMPVLKTRRRLRDMRPGQQLAVLTSDPLAVIDIPAFCQEDGHVLLKSEGLSMGHRFLIARGD
ncbi:response regulator SirA [Notoacmeibacter marinus]|uniref:Response regulator SirA n=1 Tax=Notoacmeibacter marinus TaxID=1876515 RepID=A0A231V392_9HYPH|nr:sulfurtransferase TusA family protein [Notoacmeibacter marinus]OXT02655.1 response regulator SirA [Notoacmeibacter marinus]